MKVGESLASKVFNVLNYCLFTVIGLITLYPMWYVLMYSLSNPNLKRLNSMFLVPVGFTLETYRYVLSQQSILTGFKNTIFIVVMGTALSLMVVSLAAYPLSRERFLGKNLIFGLFMFTMLFNGGMVPTYLVVQKLGLVDSLWALILPGIMSVYYMLIMIRFFKNIPSSLIESAKIDGCNDMFILFRIVMPMSTAAFAAIGLFCAVGYWNDYLSSVIYINSLDKRPIQLVLYGLLRQNLAASQFGFENPILTPDTIKMATVIVALLPIVIVYPFIQKHFMKGVTLGAVKG